MARQLHIFKSEVSGEMLTMPVTPNAYTIEHGRKVEVTAMHTAGEIAQPGAKIALDTELTYLLPAQDYPFVNAGASANPFFYLEKLEKWSDAGEKLRFLITGTPINVGVLLGPIKYEAKEDDVSGDLYVRVPMVERRDLTAESKQINQTTGNLGRGDMAATGGTYVVVAGDTLSSICRRFYGDASLYPRLATANGIKNPHLIYVGQVLKIPALTALPAAGTMAKSAQIAKASTTKITVTGVQKIMIDKAKNSLLFKHDSSLLEGIK